ncbi:ABC transporter permease [Desulfovibrio mangrovi]|uniref:MlaE family ABC transporter permease n=1 Tax=Desulfovibrio mangrovi TaxID=2976983 RepID=UPI0022456939|nr:ABC transporter permease [Desulfovibrio mangrovi]UZP66554.1 ABC transporter permease [Desulfovibrio mangrovi]
MWKELAILAGLINDLVKCLGGIFKRRRAFYSWQNWNHLTAVGTGSIGIVTTIAACTGMILALQAAGQLEKIGALSYVANMVSVTIIKELGPLLTAIILTGRSGAAFCAELATMKISEEIDALQVIGIDPIRFLVWPKLIAMSLMLPILTLIADMVGIVAGGLFSAIFLGLTLKTYFDQCVEFLTVGDVFSGLIKALGFGITITIVSCWQGMMARDGAADVGRRTTRAVAQSIFLIILLDFFFTAINYTFM